MNNEDKKDMRNVKRNKESVYIAILILHFC